MNSLDTLRAGVRAATYRAEPDCVAALLPQAQLDAAALARVQDLARRLSLALRERGGGRRSLAQDFLQEFALGTEEGVALMCLAEALLRIPDDATREALIRDKLAQGDWRPHVGHSDSWMVNAAAWGLFLGGRLSGTRSEAGLSASLGAWSARAGAPLLLVAAERAMALISGQFVAGETMEAALEQARGMEARGFRHSFDMLGEAALTAEDAGRYTAAYAGAIAAIGARAGAQAQGMGTEQRPGISVKLSALHPRYERAQRARVLAELLPRLAGLAAQARALGLGLNIDAEEAHRLELSLELFQALCREPALAGWDGLGFVVQAYQKRAPFVIDWLAALARGSGQRLLVRLVKGAYWDGEIKRAQVEGLPGYPVYTRKAHTDVCYLACARRLFAAGEALYPQFGTHNAMTLAGVRELGMQWEREHGRPARYEFQCLHGMGEALYGQVVAAKEQGGLGLPCRIYAPVGPHRTLLPYLVRRLLENGANTSFIHALGDERVPLDELLADPAGSVRAQPHPGAPHPDIPLPSDLYGAVRRNSRGMDLSDEDELAALAQGWPQWVGMAWQAAPTLAGAGEVMALPRRPVLNPARPADEVGEVWEADGQSLEAALACAARAQAAWDAAGAGHRAGVLERAADLVEARRDALLSLLVREAGKTLSAAVAELRETADYLRYYALQARRLRGAPARGIVACISPWNFPLAIFTGQAAAALAAGNAVIAKPAEQAPLIAAEAVRLLQSAGVPAGALQLLPGSGETVGAALTADARVQGVMFTGSTEVAKLIQRALAARLDAQGRPVLLVAETGGQNAIIVDSSALAEQAVDDVLQSAFDSAGQRCSSSRLLCLQEDVAGEVLALLEGAMRELRVGDPSALSTDVGPVIDAPAREALRRHVEDMRAQGCAVRQLDVPAQLSGTFFPPTLIEIDRASQLEGEVFGPVLHVLRYRREALPALLREIAAAGYGLTMGVQSRIDERIDRVAAHARVGNLYVNRNIIGAVVGVQPFGGEGLSGTGPKAGGPLYVAKLTRSGAAPLAATAHERLPAAALGLVDWLHATGESGLAAQAARYCDDSLYGHAEELAGPTGERNVYALHPRGGVLCLAEDREDLLLQLAAVLASGNRALWPERPWGRTLHAQLPPAVRDSVALIRDWRQAAFSHALFAGGREALLAFHRELASRPGPVVEVQVSDYSMAALMSERCVSVNTAAAGGNPTLMEIG